MAGVTWHTGGGPSSVRRSMMIKDRSAKRSNYGTSAIVNGTRSA
jgi:hypothetical protein